MVRFDQADFWLKEVVFGQNRCWSEEAGSQVATCCQMEQLAVVEREEAEREASAREGRKVRGRERERKEKREKKKVKMIFVFDFLNI